MVGTVGKMFASLDDASWYHGRITRDQAIEILLQNGRQEGLFLVRNKAGGSEDNFVLSLWHGNQALHFQIQSRGGIYYSIDDGPSFEGLDSLIEYYREQADGLPIRLTQFCQGNPPPASCRKHGVTTPLHLACAEGNFKLVLGLLTGQNQSDITTRNENGVTPLHEAALRGDEDIVSILLRHGADTKSKDDGGNTPLQVQYFIFTKIFCFEYLPLDNRASNFDFYLYFLLKILRTDMSVISRYLNKIFIRTIYI